MLTLLRLYQQEIEDERRGLLQLRDSWDAAVAHSKRISDAVMEEPKQILNNILVLGAFGVWLPHARAQLCLAQEAEALAAAALDSQGVRLAAARASSQAVMNVLRHEAVALATRSAQKAQIEFDEARPW